MKRDYRKIYNQEDSEMLEDADQAITSCNLWDWLKNYSPQERKGFMFSRHPNLDRINDAMKYGGHSGSSYAWTMRTMENIAKGTLVIPEKKEVTLVEFAEVVCQGLPDGQQQLEAIKKFSEGKLSYAEMRSLCG